MASGDVAIRGGLNLGLRYIDWIWHVRGSMIIPSRLSADAAFDRLDALFREPGTTYVRDGETLVFQKKNQASQDKMAVFDSGVVRVESDPQGTRLSYDLVSKTLLLCFLAPALFFGFGEFFKYTSSHHTVALVDHTPNAKSMVANLKSGKDDTIQLLNPIDNFMGAPKPEKKDASAKLSPSKEKKKISSTTSYVFAGLFAFLYVIGRILEQYLVHRNFRKNISKNNGKQVMDSGLATRRIASYKMLLK
ncbi:hypothetical protein [Acidomonas methanolica]|uniref:hypothetical protein n=1 Tax=Acidomonas methanolica TaxID=437 RepID=UPI00164AAC69|nr:hypothetical protein [Acidomonas methanolica]MBU2655575.1 hypothetical protein [Acidomonas methanolica]